MRERLAAVAQSVERVIGNDEVGSSNLPSSSRKILETTWFQGFFLSSAKHVFSKLPTKPCACVILESVKKLEELFIAPTARQILHEMAQRAFARCECA